MFKGILSPVVTILDENGKLDFAGNKIVINRLIEHGINGLLFLGSIGEFFALSKAEKQQFISFVVKTVDKRVPVLIGTGGTVQDEVIELTRFAEQAGADAAVVISPYYFKLDQETIYRYYAGVAQSTALPIMLYNFPDRTAVDLGPELVLRLAREFKHIVAIKDTVDNISHTRKLIQAVKAERPDFSVLSGFDEYLIPNLMAGGDGILGGLTNVIPHVFSDLMQAYAKKDLARVEAAQDKISILMNLYDVSQPFVAAIKGAVAQMGVPITPGVKAPASALTSRQLQEIRELLIQADVLDSL
ncbi:4-hydroxy-tetrahydrodipicolinate synthase [Sporomusa sp.]|jgi:4-hydroxy-tetrahydrodipicolinate synthase|uniref:4-hydroxy-tetrahydrodipicolinate synthase n=1 Tax=Sporomusa sp. TaxID=2078658 RepID=UPI002CB73728|nr:4-hydroxy-tetrahydrodipicolinate synthase [Sporomusa sp.]MDF2874791.1 yagE [Sporomusa sp.]HWR06555.1 4-hydroxy-tetrahydrodipicolinate synthase [Sporomusa sp.]